MSERDILSTEWDLLDALWAMERGTAREVTEAVADKRGWAYSTVKTMLDRMKKRGLVDARRVGNVWEYTPKVRRQQAQQSAWRRFVEIAFGGKTASALHFAAGELSEDERVALLAQLGVGEEE